MEEEIVDPYAELLKLEVKCLETKNQILEDMNKRHEKGEDVTDLINEMYKLDWMIKDIRENYKFKGAEQLEIYITKMIKIYNEKHPRWGSSIIIGDGEEKFYFTVHEAEYLMEQLKVLIDETKKDMDDEEEN